MADNYTLYGLQSDYGDALLSSGKDHDMGTTSSIDEI